MVAIKGYIITLAKTIHNIHGLTLLPLAMKGQTVNSFLGRKEQET